MSHENTACIYLTSEDEFQQYVQSSERILVDFYADRCGPCQMITPVLEEIAQQHPEKKIIKVNVDSFPEIAAQYGVMSIPAVFAIENGEEKDQKIGAASKSDYEMMLMPSSEEWKLVA